jgi:hypothetical protein
VCGPFPGPKSINAANLSGSITYLQGKICTSTGGATLYISHDKVELAIGNPR